MTRNVKSEYVTKRLEEIKGQHDQNVPKRKRPRRKRQPKVDCEFEWLMRMSIGPDGEICGHRD